jgi:hypothetical protein
MRTGDRTPSRTIDSSVVIKTFVNSLLREHVSTRRCLEMALLSDFTIPAFRRQVTILLHDVVIYKFPLWRTSE